MKKWTDARAKAIMAARMGGVKYDISDYPRKREWLLNGEDVTREIEWAIRVGNLRVKFDWPNPPKFE